MTVKRLLLYVMLIPITISLGCDNKDNGTESVQNGETKKAESDVTDGKIQPCEETFQEIGDRVLREANEIIQQSEQYKAALKILKEVKSGKRQWTVQIKWVEYAEISPDEFLAFEQCDTVLDPELAHSLHPDMFPDDLDGSSEVIIPWKENRIHWKGVDVPISLRVYQDTLYMIGFDRETDRQNWRFRFYRQEENEFREIVPDEYPKSIATQNLWFSDIHKNININGVILAINLNPKASWFDDSLTAMIWCQLMTGKEYHEISLDRDAIRKICEEYIAEYKPIKLTKIIYEQESGDTKGFNDKLKQKMEEAKATQERIEKKVAEYKAGKRNLFVHGKEKVEYAEIRPREFLAFKSIKLLPDSDLATGLPKGLFKGWNGKFEIVILWKGNEIHWEVIGGLKSLRVHDDTLYAIILDPENDERFKFRLRYYKQVGNQFKEIKPDEYPKTIATQNLRFTKWQIEGGTVDVEINMDTDSFQFPRSLTAT
ncbi:MAG: hypothetical protein ABFR90_08985, partial [Planctomycetota bacterium]